MEKSKIVKEVLSRLKIELKETLFYLPGELVKGTIKLFPGFKLNLTNNLLHFKLKLVQYEFWEYTNIKIDELKNVYKTQIKETFLDYTLKKEEYESIFEEENKNVEEDSIILIEKIKEENNDFFSIPFEFKIDENNQNLLPTFQFKYNTYILGIRHILIIESE